MIKSARLILREFTQADLEDFSLLVADADVMRFSVSGPVSKDQAAHYFQQRVLNHYVEYGFGLFALFTQDRGIFIGFAGLMSQQIEGEEVVELCFRLHSQYWGQGLASEATLAICEYAFNELNLEQVISIIDPHNHRALKIAHRIGMHFWKKSLFHSIPVHIYALTKIVLHAFQESWHTTFEKERSRLKEAFKNLDIAFFHIGSTAITGCAAKPVIDILGVTSDVTQVETYNDVMIHLGYEPMGEYGMCQRRYFRKKYPFAVHLHIFEDTDPEVGRHLRFCNYLQTHSEKRQEYSLLKQQLAKQFPHDVGQYCLIKDRWIKTIDIAAAWENQPNTLTIKSKLRKKSWSSQEILKAMEVNMRLHMTYFARYLPIMNMPVEPDVTVVCSEIQDDTFNYVLFAKFTETNARHRIQHVINIFKHKHLPFSWWVGHEDTPLQLSEILLKEGLMFKEEDVGMYLELDTCHSPIPQTDLCFCRVHSLEALKDFSQVIIDIGGHPRAFEIIYNKLPPVLYNEDASFEMHVAYLDQQPIVTGILVLHANAAGIYYVATQIGHRKRGYGSAMMIHLLNRAKSKGYMIATLQASQAGKTLYERLGFKQCCLFKEYAWHASDSL